MKINHVHMSVRNLPASIGWMSNVWEVQPSFENDRMAVFLLGSFTLILDSSDHDSVATVGFESETCDADYERLIARGAQSIEKPADKPWGVRAAYVKGPGALKFEIEQPLK